MSAQLGFVQLDPEQAPIWMGPAKRASLKPAKTPPAHPIVAPSATELELEQQRARARADACLERRLAPGGMEVLGLVRILAGMASTTTIAYRLGLDRPWMRASALSSHLYAPDTWTSLEPFTEVLEP